MHLDLLLSVVVGEVAPTGSLKSLTTCQRSKRTGPQPLSCHGSKGSRALGPEPRDAELRLWGLYRASPAGGK